MIKGFGIGDISIDCADPARTREFYAKISGWTEHEMYNCPALTNANGFTVLFMGCDFVYGPPIWPEETGKQQKQTHFNFGVDDLDAAVAEAVDLVASRLDAQFGGNEMEHISGSDIYRKYARLSGGCDMVIGDIANDRMFVVSL